MKNAGNKNHKKMKSKDERGMITKENIAKHELIGLGVRVKNSANRDLMGIKGIVVFETKSILQISNGAKTFAVPKAACAFEFELPHGGRASVEGKLIAYRPEDRPKKSKK